MAFASPLFSQIRYLVLNLTKKNQAASASELNQVRFLQPRLFNCQHRSSHVNGVLANVHYLAAFSLRRWPVACLPQSYIHFAFHIVCTVPQLVNLYGQDARVFLLACLVEETDFKSSNQAAKDVPKVSARVRWLVGWRRGK